MCRAESRELIERLSHRGLKLTVSILARIAELYREHRQRPGFWTGRFEIRSDA